MSEDDRYYMAMALREAKKGIGKTSPNPAVGAVIVRDGEVIATGYHKKAGTPHAEIHALRAAGTKARGAEMYVTLEPCNHTGKTPPCSHAVADAGIARVVVGMEDPNPLVDGTGITYLRERGVEVVSGILADRCREINRPFIKHVTTGLPWVVMKAGLSLDGRLNYTAGEAGWITGPESSRQVHRLRNTYDAILIGSSTAIIDDPSLTTRLARGRGKDPVRVILDSSLSIPLQSKIFHHDNPAATWVFCGEHVSAERKARLGELGVRLFTVPVVNGKLDLMRVLQLLGGEGITSVLVEGGASVHGAMLERQLVDFAQLFLAPRFAGDGGVPLLSGFSVNNRDQSPWLDEVRYRRLGQDMLISGLLHYPQQTP